MCDHPNREAAMVVLRRDETGKPTVWCDPCIAAIVDALNTGDRSTVWSCCGHGRIPGVIGLADGRQLMLMPDLESLRDFHRFLGKTINDPIEQQGDSGEEACPRCGDGIESGLPTPEGDPTQRYAADICAACDREVTAPVKYVDFDPEDPSLIATSAAHVHVRGAERCLRNETGVPCLSPEELRAEVERLKATMSVVAANLAADLALAEAERNALRVQVAAVRAYADGLDDTTGSHLQWNMPERSMYAREIRAVLDAVEPARPAEGTAP